MSWWNDLAYRWRSLTERRQQDTELDEELRFHLEMEVERRVAAGATEAQARRAARLAFGAPESVKEACRDAWGTRLLDNLGRDLRVAARQLHKGWRFSTVAVASLAIGIGAAAVMFSVVDAVLLQPLPFGEPERVVSFWELTPGGERFSSSDANVLDFGQRATTLSGLAGIRFPAIRPSLRHGSDRVPLDAFAVTPSFFDVLGVPARLGRTFGAEEAVVQDRPRTVVVSEAAWRRHFAADTDVIGREIDLDGELWTVIGVLPRGFRFGVATPDLYLPSPADASFDRGDHRLSTVARLAPGVSLAQANAEVATIAAQLAREYPDSNDGWSAEVEPVSETFLGPTTRRANVVLLGAVGLLLLLACANVSNLLLARGADRADEIRLRLALGASRWRVAAQLFTESVLLALLGAFGGGLLALGAVPLVRRLDVPLPRLDEMSVDLRLLAFVALLALLSVLLFGLLPSLRLTSKSARLGVRTARHGSSRRDSRLRSGLVAVEVALAVVLAVGSGLLVHSFEQLRSVDVGFEAAGPGDGGVLLAQFDLPPERYPESGEATRRFYDNLLPQLQALPAVTAVGGSIVSPFRGPTPSNVVSSEAEVDVDAFTRVQWRSVTPDYFRALGIALLRGSSFSATGDPQMHAVVSSRLASRLWPGEDPIGQRVRWISPEGPLFEVIGVASEVQDLFLGQDPPAMIYLPQRLIGWPNLTVALRTQQEPSSLAPAVRSVVREIDPLLAPPPFSTLDEHRREALAEPLLSLQLMSVFAAIALILAAVGVYGVVAYAVSRRRRELGVRVALGAQPRQLVNLVLRDGARMVGLGLVGGLLASLALVGTLRALLYQTSPFNPTVLLGVVVLLFLVGLTATWLPARRGARQDPLRALREE